MLLKRDIIFKITNALIVTKIGEIVIFKKMDNALNVLVIRLYHWTLMNVLIELIAKLKMEFHRTDIKLVIINVLIVKIFGMKVISK